MKTQLLRFATSPKSTMRDACNDSSLFLIHALWLTVISSTPQGINHQLETKRHPLPAILYTFPFSWIEAYVYESYMAPGVCFNWTLQTLHPWTGLVIHLIIHYILFESLLVSEFNPPSSFMIFSLLLLYWPLFQPLLISFTRGI